MNSRERVRAVLEHRVPDRVPNGLGGCETAGLHIVAYDRLQRVVGCTPQPPRLDTFMTNAVFEEPLIRAMEGDIILLASPNMCDAELRGDTAAQWRPQRLWGKSFRVPLPEVFKEREDGSLVWRRHGRELICPKGTFYFDSAKGTDMFADFDIPDPDTFHPKDTIDEKVLRHLEQQAKRLYEETDLSICLGESIRDLQYAPGGMVGSMMLMLEEPEVMKALLDKCADAALRQIALLEQAVGKYVDILSIAHDFGDNRGVTIGAPLWREIYKDAYKKLFDGWHRLTNMKVNLHSCGSIRDIMGDLIECGVDVLNPVQTSAARMEAAELKAEFGKELVFWGGAYDAQLIPRSADYDTVYRTVCQNIRILGKDGGFIFAGVHNLPADLPEHHLKAMLDALRDTRDY